MQVRPTAVRSSSTIELTRPRNPVAVQIEGQQRDFIKDKENDDPEDHLLSEIGPEMDPSDAHPYGVPCPKDIKAEINAELCQKIRVELAMELQQQRKRNKGKRAYSRDH